MVSANYTLTTGTTFTVLLIVITIERTITLAAITVLCVFTCSVILQFIIV